MMPLVGGRVPASVSRGVHEAQGSLHGGDRAVGPRLPRAPAVAHEPNLAREALMTAAPHLIADQAAPIAPVRTSSRWVKGLHPDRPLDEAARHVLTARLEDLQRRLSTASKELD